MQRNILYEHAITLPRTSGHFHRPRIDKLLAGFLDRHLIVVTAGAGWGKTQAVSTFLNNAPARVMWLQVSELDNHVTRFWEEFVYIAAYQNKETATRLERLGFPETLAKFDQFLRILAKVIYAREQVVFVIDDFHLIHDESIIRFIKNLIFAKLENFCIIINSRAKLSFNLTGMITGDLAGYISSDDLCFTPSETEGYLKQQNITLPARELEKVQTSTEGWPLALYLVGLTIKKGFTVSNDPIAGAIPLIFGMIEKELFSDFDPQVRDFLVKASLLNSFPKGILKVLAGGHFDTVAEFVNTNMFVYYNPYTGYYNFHHLFLEFLKGKQDYLTRQEIDDTYLKAADWCVANDQKLEAFGYYDKCGRYDKILDIMVNDPLSATFSKALADFYLGIIDRFPEELVKKNPMIHVHHAGLLLNNAEPRAAIQELLQTQKELEALPPEKDTIYALGNIYFLLGLISKMSCNYDFMELFKKASECLPNGGWADNTARSGSTKYTITLINPAPGELKKMEDALFYAMPYASKAMRGYGYGTEYLASAEAAYFTGDMKKAAKHAYEAVYRAREKRAGDVASAGYYLIMRIEAFNGNYEGVVSNMEQLRAFVENTKDRWNFNGMPDVAEGWFNVIVGQMEKVADWIVDDALGGDVLAPYSVGMERLVKARYLLKQGKYYELLAWLGQSEEMFRQNNTWLVLLDILIYKSIAYHHIQDEEQSVFALREAYAIAHGNNLVTQFIELGNDMRAVIYTARHSKLNTVPGAWLDEISTKAATYEKHLNNMRSQHHKTSGFASKPSIKFTKREEEMLRYLCQGLTNMEIASTRYISISAVKKSLNNIYMKLGAKNRADAVRLAIHMELN